MVKMIELLLLGMQYTLFKMGGIIRTFKRKLIKIDNFFLKKKSLFNQNIIITGANSGIGFDLVTKLYNHNNILAFINKDDENINKIISNKIKIITCDFRNTEFIKNHKQIILDFRPSIIINCAATFGPKKQKFKDFDLHEFSLVLNVNVYSPLLLIQAALNGDDTIKQIVNITSSMGSITLNKDGDYYYYRSSKTLLNTITKNLSVDLKKKDINVLCIHPGSIKTKMNPSGDMSIDMASQNIITISSDNNFAFNGKLIDTNQTILEW